MRISSIRTLDFGENKASSVAILMAFIATVFMVLLFFNHSSNLHLFGLLLILLPAVGLAISDSKYLVPYIIWTWAFTPEIRRFADWSGLAYQNVPIISIAPLLATSTLAIAIYRRSLRISPPVKRALACFAVALLYGGILGLIRNGWASLYESSNYVIPLLFVLYGLSRSAETGERDLWIRAYIYASILVSIYGWIQFLVVPPWDAFWMDHCAMESIGVPRPFLVRVFSTLNTPGHAATMLGIALSVLLLDKRFRGTWGWLWILLISSAMLITLVRGTWLMVFAFLMASILATRAKNRWRLIGGIAVAGILVAVIAPFLPGGKVIVERMASVQNLSQDQSFSDRQNFAAKIIPRLVDNPLGNGTGAIGVGNKLGTSDAHLNYSDFDNGILATFMTFGIVGALAFFAGLANLYLAIKRSRRISPHLAANAPLAVGALWYILSAMLFGSPIPGLGGALMYLFISTAIAKPSPKTVPELQRT